MFVYQDLEGDIPSLFEATLICLKGQKDHEKFQSQDNRPPSRRRTEGVLSVKQEL
jgi:hypothetical protein